MRFERLENFHLWFTAFWSIYRARLRKDSGTIELSLYITFSAFLHMDIPWERRLLFVEQAIEDIVPFEKCDLRPVRLALNAIRRTRVWRDSKRQSQPTAITHRL